MPKPEDREVLDLWEYNFATNQKQLLVDSNSITGGKETLSEEEKARRERLRVSERGITEYYWDHAGKLLVFPLGGDIYLYDLEKKRTQQLTKTKEAEIDIRFSPKDSFVSYIRNRNLYVLKLSTNKEIAITSGTKKEISFGVAEFIAQEEMNRFTGYWWSEDEKWVAFTKTDESPVQIAKRYEIDADKVEVREQRYPYTGTPNAIVELYYAAIPESPSVKITHQKVNFEKSHDIYLPRVKWLPNSKMLSYQVQSRDQKTLDLYFFDLATKKSQKILSEQDPYWVNLNYSLKFIKDRDLFVWCSERSGYRHIYLYDYSGKVVGQLTTGEWDVDEVLAVDEKSKSVYFTSGYKTPLEKHLLTLSYEAAGEPKVLTNKPGWHGIEIDETKSYFMDYFSNENTPPQASVHKINGELLTYIEENKVSLDHPLAPYFKFLINKTYRSLKLPDQTEIFYNLLRPKNNRPANGYPTVVWIYGGPTNQIVAKRWGGTTDLWHQTLAQNGYLVIEIDNRGTPRRGRKFANPIYGELGKVESSDFAAVVKSLIAEKLIDPNKVLIGGWSYGGYMSLLSLEHQPDIFRYALSVAPVTDWTLYDTHYTERYLGTPQGNPNGYKQSNVVTHVDKIRGGLMVIHGMADDNVLFTHSTLLFKKLQEQGKLFQTMVYPGAKHGISGKQNKIHVYNSMNEFIKKSLTQ